MTLWPVVVILLCVSVVCLSISLRRTRRRNDTLQTAVKELEGMVLEGLQRETYLQDRLGVRE